MKMQRNLGWLALLAALFLSGSGCDGVASEIAAPDGSDIQPACQCSLPVATCLGSRRVAPVAARCLEDGGCGFIHQETFCDQGCDGGACVGEPCQGVVCNQPPAAECTSPTTLRVYPVTGACQGGGCLYVGTEISCTCANGRCENNLCAGQTCASPPPAVCVGGAVRSYASPGSCDAATGTCSYASTDTPCGAGGCNGGQCVSNKCAGVSCNQPPAPSCADLTTTLTFLAPGTCDASTGVCSYQPKTVPCPAGQQCSLGACSIPPPTCNASNCPGCCNGTACVALSAQTNGQCGRGGAACGSCGGATPVCRTGTCVNLCNGVTCNQPPAPSCLDAVTAQTWTSPGTCDPATGACSYQPKTVSCPAGQQCSQGACINLPPTCGASNCSGCCNGTTCVAISAQTNWQCGSGGASCAACGGGTPVCRTGTCVNLCNGVTCSQPPAPSCLDSVTAQTWATPGTCDPATGTCSYTSTSMACSSGSVCSAGQCVEANTWKLKASMQSLDPGMTYDAARQRTLLVEGASGRIWEWDGGSWTVRQPASALPSRYNFEIAYDAARQRVVLFGGRSSNQCLNDTWEWDGTSWRSTAPASRPPARCNHAMAFDPVRQRIILFGGGVNVLGSQNLDDTWEWDGTNWTARAPTSKPPARSGHELASNGQRLVLFGGYSGTQYLNDTWEWDGTNWTARAPASKPATRSGHALQFDGQRIVLFGGYDGSQRLGDMWSWDGTNWTQASPAPRPPARTGPVTAYDAPRKRLVLFGGYDGNRWLNDTWEWNGTSWNNPVPLSPDVGMESWPALTYDGARQRIILFGSKTWEWDGTTWAQKSPATNPPQRSDLALAYDPGRQRVMLFGGWNSSGSLSDTWEWDGTNWTQKSPSSKPSARYAHRMAYDGQRIVLFAGTNGSDTWRWDGTNWTKKSPATTPPGRFDHGMAFDAARGRTVLFGGGGSALFNDTWEWDGTNWTQKFPSSSPPARHSHGLTYDSVRKRVVLFGGTNGSKYFNDTWEWDGTNWTLKSPPSSPPVGDGDQMAYDAARQRIVLFMGSTTWEYGP